ncbi:metallophosphoesterase [Pelobium manganitolerans]|uniref:metallophosphoesterase n=1 Tax=Pelobium manganitolerans TaxID=1842495 RepID=UPI003FA3CD4C
MGKFIGLSIIWLLLLAFDVYIYKAVLNIYPAWSAKRKRRFAQLWWGYTAVLFVGVLLSMSFGIKLSFRTVFLVAFFITFMSKLVWALVLLVDDIRRGTFFLKQKVVKQQPEANAEKNAIPRSEFLVKAGMALAAVPLSSLTWGVVSGAYDYRIRRQVLTLENLPREFDGIKIAQISDVHSGSFYNKKAVLGGVEMMMAEKPELAFFTGDLVNGKAGEMRDYQDIFAKIKAPLGVYSVLGNHDYGMYEKWKNEAERVKNIEDVKNTHGIMGWNLLMNEHRRVKVDGAEIGILGIENWGIGRFPKFGKMEEAVKDTDDLAVKLLLSHDPSQWRAQVLKDYPQIDVSFAGHTHGGQFGVETGYGNWSPVQYIYNEWDGLYREGKQQLYVNVGYGFLGYPGRVGILPEITIFELKRG